MGRVTRQQDWLGNGLNAAYDRTVTLNAKGQVTAETVVSKQGADTISTSSTHDYGSGSTYALGAVVSTYKNKYLSELFEHHQRLRLVRGRGAVVDLDDDDDDDLFAELFVGDAHDLALL